MHDTAALLDEVRAVSSRLQAQLDTLEEASDGHLWIYPAFIQSSRGHLEQNLREVKAVIQRLQTVHDSYAQLPVRDERGAGTRQA